MDTLKFEMLAATAAVAVVIVFVFTNALINNATFV